MCMWESRELQPGEPGWWLSSDGRWYPPEASQSFLPECVFLVAADFPSNGFFRWHLSGGRFFRLRLNNEHLSIEPRVRIIERLVPAVSCALADIERVVPYSAPLFHRFDFYVRGGTRYEVSLVARDERSLANELALRGVKVERTR